MAKKEHVFYKPKEQREKERGKYIPRSSKKAALVVWDVWMEM